jgi:hypothetical protein
VCCIRLKREEEIVLWPNIVKAVEMMVSTKLPRREEEAGFPRDPLMNNHDPAGS